MPSIITLPSKPLLPPPSKKKPKPIITEDGMIFDSNEERYFYWWLKELNAAGAIKCVTRCNSYDLAGPVRIGAFNTKGKLCPLTIMREATYTPDFSVVWATDHPITHKISRYILDNRTHEDRPIYRTRPDESVFEVKPLMLRRDARQAQQLAISQVYRKWLWQRHTIFAQLVMIGNTPKGWFAETFTPDRFRLTDKTKQARTLNYPVRTLAQWLEGLK